MQIDAQTALNFVIGNPISHSQSPALHQALYEKAGINAVMLAIENPDLSALVKSIRSLKVRLTAVTLPYKQEILQYVDWQSDEVKALGAANTLILEAGKLMAYNTDVTGIKKAFEGIDTKGKNILIIGAGGAACAAAYCFSESVLFYLNRDHNKARELASLFSGEMIQTESLNNQPFDIIINATSVGLLSDETPLPGYLFHSDQIVFDMVYTPENTRLIREAHQLGARTLSGKIMFQAQALKQIELAYGVKP